MFRCLTALSVLLFLQVCGQNPVNGIVLRDTLPGIIVDSLSHNLGIVGWVDTTVVKYFKYTGTERVVIARTFTSDPYYISEWPKEPLVPGQLYNVKVCFNFAAKTGVIDKRIGFELSNGERVEYEFSGKIVPIGQSPFDKKDDQFRQAVETVINAFRNGDSAVLNKFVNPKYGVYFVGRIGVYDVIDHETSIDHGYGGSQTYDGFKGIRAVSLTYAPLPAYDCGTENWSKQGVFCDTTKTDHLLEKTANWNMKYGTQKFTSAEVNGFRELENMSRKVIVTVKTGRSLIFSLSYIDYNWWLTIMDFVEDDCSA